MRFIDEVSLERLNMREIFDRIEPMSGYGRERLKKITPFRVNEKEKLKEEFSIMSLLTESYIKKRELFKKIEMTIEKLKNIKTIVELFDEEYLYDDTDFFEFKFQGILFEELREYLKELPEGLTQFKLLKISEIIDILDPRKDRIPTFYIYDSYSEELGKIRERKRVVEKDIYEERDFEKVEILKKERLEYVVLEEREERKVRERLMSEIRPHMEKFKKNIETISKLDFSLGKIKFSLKYGGVEPEISEDSTFIANSLINLELKEFLELKGREITPIDIELKMGTNIITGANMGGKSIAMKTIAQNIILFHYGIFPLAKTARFPMMDFIFFISDDMQDLSKGLSTFGAEIIKLKEVSVFLELGKGMVFFDEFARGTNPEEGRRFVKALSQYLNKKKSIALLTTHFDGIASDSMNHYQVVGLKNIDFEKLKYTMNLKKNSLKILQEHMDYRLEKTKEYSVPRYAFNIGVLLGVNEEFLKSLEEQYKGDCQDGE